MRISDWSSDVCSSDLFKLGSRRGGFLDRLVHAAEQALGPPGHHRLQDGVLGREVAEERALGQTHPLGDGRRGDVARVLFHGQADHRLHGRRPSPVSGKMSGTPGPSLTTPKLVIYYYKTA